MKSTIIAIVLLVLVIGFVIINAFIVSGICKELITLTEEASLKELKEYWDKKSYYISLSTHLSVLEDADKALVEMQAYQETGDEVEFNASKKKFLNALDEISTGEKVNFYNIF